VALEALNIRLIIALVFIIIGFALALTGRSPADRKRERQEPGTTPLDGSGLFVLVG
jgi:hypothetical protein